MDGKMSSDGAEVFNESSVKMCKPQETMQLHPGLWNQSHLYRLGLGWVRPDLPTLKNVSKKSYLRNMQLTFLSLDLQA